MLTMSQDYHQSDDSESEPELPRIKKRFKLTSSQVDHFLDNDVDESVYEETNDLETPSRALSPRVTNKTPSRKSVSHGARASVSSGVRASVYSGARASVNSGASANVKNRRNGNPHADKTPTRKNSSLLQLNVNASDSDIDDDEDAIIDNTQDTLQPLPLNIDKTLRDITISLNDVARRIHSMENVLKYCSSVSPSSTSSCGSSKKVRSSVPLLV